MNNVEISDLLKGIAAAYKLQEGKNNRFKIIAYERAADAVQHLSSEAKDLWDDGKLQSVSGIGPSIAQHLGEIFEKGESSHFKIVMADIPASVFELIKVSGIGPKTAFRFAKELNISDKDPINDLKKKAEKGMIAELEGFGEDSEKSILDGIKELKGRDTRMLLSYAEQTSQLIIDWMKNDVNIVQIEVLGSLRRKAPTIGDIDIAAATKDTRSTLEHFTKYPKTNRVIEIGEHTASIIIPGNIQVDLMVQNPSTFGSLLQHFTGSKHHNIALREHARSLSPSLSLSEYGIREIKDQKSKIKDQRSKIKDQKSKIKSQNYNSKLKIYQHQSEEDFYDALGMEWIPPELRENRGEIQAAINGELPQLVELSSIKGDLHVHSNFDVETSHDLGASSMDDNIKKAEELGYEYIAFTEHNPSQSGHSDKQIIDILKRKSEAVEKINEEISSGRRSATRTMKRVFNSLEIDILPDGSLPVPDQGLETLDFALVSIHSSFRQNRKKMTSRIINAVEHPKVKIWAHPTGRRLGEREGVEVDWEQVFEVFQQEKKMIEINSDPMRLDLPDILVKDAIEMGIVLTMGTDAHHIDAMDNMKYALNVARRGWAKNSDILNTYSLESVEKMLESFK